jgi:hypothetical protein
MPRRYGPALPLSYEAAQFGNNGEERPRVIHRRPSTDEIKTGSDLSVIACDTVARRGLSGSEIGVHTGSRTLTSTFAGLRAFHYTMRT